MVFEDAFGIAQSFLDVIRLALRTLGQERQLLEAREQFLATWLAETDRTLTNDAVEAVAQKYDL